MLCYPPLGQATVVSAGQDYVKFIVHLESADGIALEKSSKNKPWEVALWHDTNREGGEAIWEEVYFSETSQAHHVLHRSTDNHNRQQIFTLCLRGRPRNKTQVNFTIKYRIGGEGSAWKWANDDFSCGDGRLLYQPEFEPRELSHFIEGKSQHITTKALTAETPNTHLWTLSAPVKPAEEEQSGYSTHVLGTPLNYSRWFALVRLWTPWLAPRQGSSKFSPDKEAVLAAFLRNDGLHVAVLAISGVDDVLTLLTYDELGNVVIKGRNDAASEGVSRVLVAVAETFEIANAAVMYEARKIVMGQSLTEKEAELVALQKDVKPQWLEEWADGFAFCTWNSLGQKLTEERIYAALDSLRNADIQITNLIIDDLWQSVDHEGAEQYVRAMTCFEANRKGFPSGLWHTVHEIRKRNPSIQHVAVWHAILGYWGGISPDGQLAKDYKTTKVGGPDWLCIDPEDASRWYSDFYTFLLDSGIDSVKTDAQHMLEDLKSAKDRRRYIAEFQDVWSIAMLRNFSGRGISCMSQTPQMIFRSQLPTNKPRMLVRNSDDFFPDVEASHPWHIFCNAHNSLLTQHLNVLPDWDMFQTAHPWAGFHAAARCLSGGPIYITDPPGEHNIELIRQITAKTPRGNTVILRTSRSGKTSQAYVGYDEPKLLKIETYTGAARTGSSMLGVFNVSKHTLSEIVTLNEFPGTETGSYIIRSHVGKGIGKPTTRRDFESVTTITLHPKGYEVYTAHPLSHHQIGERVLTVANLGLLYKFSGAAAIVGNDIYTESARKLSLYASFRALGTLGIYISDLASRSIENDLMGTMFGQPIPLHCVKRSSNFDNVLEIDTERAWNESEQKASWSNEVHINLFMF